MGREYDFEMFGHPSLLSYNERKLKIYFSEPDKGIDKETGILLLIAGFGAHASSNVYKKMRNTFADMYNLVVIQCDYFGWEFMQGANNIFLDYNRSDLEMFFNQEEIEYIFKDGNNFEKLIEISNKHKISLVAKENLKESIDNYNDMGLIQAIDNISSVISVLEIIEDNKLEFNKDKIIIYGHSHGAYLSYICNALSPTLFTLLIDNSSWLFPSYIKNSRYVYNNYGDTQLAIEFDYLAKRLEYDEEILNLSSLYKKFDNNCNIICYHGTNDNLISHEEKRVLKKIINNFQYNEIDAKLVDNIVFKSTTHGLDADFLELFNYTMNNLKLRNINRKNINFEDVYYETTKNKYLLDYSNKNPIINIKSKQFKINKDINY